MKVIGLTGGIGCGKSTFCELMAQRGVASIDTDQIARQVVAPSSIGLQQVVTAFGAEILHADGSLNRAALRQIVFADATEQSARQRLEAILHPLIQQETRRQITAFQQDGHYRQPYLLVAIPLLVEGILKQGARPDYLDEIWVLDCTPETQIVRATQRDGVSVEQIQTILAHQATREQRLSFADKVIDNEGDLTNLAVQVAAL